MATKQEIVEDALIKYGELTTLEIQQLIYTTNPQKIIQRLRKKYGVDAITTEIQKSTKTVINRLGKKLKVNVQYAKYIWRGAV